jgi:hypothetical protein
MTGFLAAFVDDTATSSATLRGKEIWDVIDVAFLDLITRIRSEKVVVIELGSHTIQVEGFKVKFCV